MATYRYSGQAVVADDDILENATGGIFVDETGATLPIYDLNDNPILTITSNAFGQSSSFKADVPMGYIKFGSILNRVFADEIAEFAVNAQAAIETANQALISAQQATSTAQEAIAIAQSGSGGLPAGTTLDAIIDGASRYALTATEKTNVGNLKLVATSGQYTDLTGTPAAAIPLSQKGAANGVASLDVAGKLTTAQIPSNVGQLNIEQAADGTWPLRNTVSSDPNARVWWWTYSATSPLPQAGNGYFGTKDTLAKKV